MENREGTWKLSHSHGWGKHGGIRSRPGSSDLGQHYSSHTHLWPVKVAMFCPTWVDCFKHGADARSWREWAYGLPRLSRPPPGLLTEMSLLSGETHQKFDEKVASSGGSVCNYVARGRSIYFTKADHSRKLLITSLLTVLT